MFDHLYVYRSVVMILRYGRNKQFKLYLSECLTFSFKDFITDKFTHVNLRYTQRPILFSE